MPEPVHHLPDFIIAGAPRSGTTWLYFLAQRHPQLAMAQPGVPEPKFFLVDELWRRGVDYYSTKWFDSLPGGRVLGEKSTNYLESTEVAERIYRALPRVKLIFLLRNPVDRAYSNYLWSRQNGLETETFERALALEEQRERDLAANLRYARPHAYFSRGLYARHLARFIASPGSRSWCCGTRIWRATSKVSPRLFIAFSGLRKCLRRRSVSGG